MDQWMKDIVDNPEKAKLYYSEFFNLQFTEIVAELMDQKGISNRQLADRLNICEGTIDSIMDGSIDPKLSLVSEILWELGVKVNLSVRKR